MNKGRVVGVTLQTGEALDTEADVMRLSMPVLVENVVRKLITYSAPVAILQGVLFSHGLKYSNRSEATVVLCYLMKRHEMQRPFDVTKAGDKDFVG